jgi:hypothetical protein
MGGPIVNDLRLALLLAAIAAPSCGGAPLDRHAAYGRIQVAEARIVHALHGIETVEPDARGARCDVACDASHAIALEADALARASEAGSDADAARRADEAARACAGCRGR